MNDEQLINSLGGPAKVAELLKFEMPSGRYRVQNWKKRGIPSSIKVKHASIFLRIKPRKQRQAQGAANA